MSSYYDILGVSKDADDQTIKKAYTKLSLKYHPDKCANKEEGLVKMQEINEAYNILKDKEKRQKYDMFGKDGLEDHQNPFEHMFRKQEREIVPPIKIQIQVELKDIFLGKKETITFERQNMCTDCDGTGCKNKIRSACQNCDGQGKSIKIIRQGSNVIQTVTNCDSCKGSGINKNAEICNKCKGNCLFAETFTYEFNIPKGSSDNIIISNIGHEIPVKMRNSDIYRGKVVLILVEKPHPIFEHEGNDLFMKMDITLAEALCGFNKTIEHVDGRKLAFIQTNPINPGDTKILANEGLPIDTYSNGSLHIILNVKFPNDLSNEEKKILYKILTKGKNLDDLDFSVPPDHVMTHECISSESRQEDRRPRGEQVQCSQQ